MFNWKNNKGLLIFTCTFIAFCALFVSVESLNEKWYTNDLLVYYEAVRDFFSGNSPYEHAYGLDSGFFKYPPFTLYLFGLFAFIPFNLAQWLHFFVLISSFLIGITLILRIIQRDFAVSTNKKYTGLLYVGFIGTAIHLVRELHMGNVNLILFGLFAIGLYFLSVGKKQQTALAWALMIILKPIMILTLVPLPFFKQWKLFITIGLLGIAFVLFPTLHLGIQGNLQLWNDWYLSVAEHGKYIVSENTMRYLSGLYLGTTSEWLPSALLLISLIGWMIFQRRKGNNSLKDLIIWSSAFCFIIPNFFVTDTEHFLLSIPLLMFLTYFLTQLKSRVMWSIAVIAILPFSFNSNDLLGKNLSDNYVDKFGWMGIANLILTGLFIYGYYQFNRRKNQSTTPE